MTTMSVAMMLRHLFRYVRPYWAMGFVLLAGLLVESGYGTFVKVSSKELIDEAIVPRRYDHLVLILVVLAVGGVLSSVIAVGCDYLWAKFGGRVMNTVRLELFEHLQRLSMDFHSRSRVGDLMTRFTSDIGAIEMGLVSALPSGIVAVMGILFSTALLFRLEWRLAILTVICLPACVLGPKLLSPKAVAADYRYKQQEAGLASIVQENLSAQAVVKAFGLQRRAAEEFREQLGVFFKAEVRASFLTYLLQRTPNVAALLASLIVIGVGAVLSFHGLLSVGSLVAFQVLLMGMSAAIGSLTSAGPYLVSAAGGMQRLREVLDEAPRVDNAARATTLPRLEHAIRFENVSFRYTPQERGLRHVDLELKAGTRVALVGSSGSGKSTLMSLIMRFYDPVEGRVCFDGTDLRTVTQESLRAQLAVVFQDDFLFNISVRDNLRLGNPEATDAELETAAKLAEIHTFLVAQPNGYDELAGERGSRFSGGQRQRLALARALVRNPAVLLLDEATSALDAGTELAINQTLARISEGRTVISVTHRLASVVDADLIVVCDEGRIVELGTHESLCRARGTYAQLWQKQHGVSVSAAHNRADVDSAWLRSLPFLQAANEDVLADIRRMFITERYAADRVILQQGDLDDKFFIIARGRVAVEGVATPGESVFLADGDYFGEIAPIKSVPRTATVRTVTMCTVLTLSGDQLRTVLPRIPGFEETLGRRYGTATA